MKEVVLLGATGSIGTNTIKVIEDEGHVLLGFSFYSNLEKALNILEKFPNTKVVACKDEEQAKIINEKYPLVKVYYGDEAISNLIDSFDKKTLVNALVGYMGLKPTIRAIKRYYDILLANKETIVIGGKIVKKLVKEYNVNLIPIDSEHTSVLEGIKNRDDIDSIYITASGGSFRDRTREELENVTVAEALNHPNWSMGSKITIDSATMFNKCLEIIEAHYLFDLPFEKIKTLLHKQSLVHSIIKFKSGSMGLMMSNNDMKIFISYALNYPNVVKTRFANLDFEDVINLELKKMDTKRYPLINLVYEGSNNPNLFTVMNASNEAAVKLFLNNKIKFLDIEKIIIKSFNSYKDFKEELNEDQLIDLTLKIYNETIERYW